MYDNGLPKFATTNRLISEECGSFDPGANQILLKSIEILALVMMLMIQNHRIDAMNCSCG